MQGLILNRLSILTSSFIQADIRAICKEHFGTRQWVLAPRLKRPSWHLSGQHSVDLPWSAGTQPWGNASRVPDTWDATDKVASESWKCDCHCWAMTLASFPK